jgi:hypothetical protein
MELENLNVWFFLFIYSSLLNLAFIGLLLNYRVIMNNNGLMPVYISDKDYYIESNQHFVFSDKNEISYFYLADIFRIRNDFFSIGDIIITFSLILTCLMVISLSYLRSKRKHL